MFGIGVPEFMVILVVALLAFGPDRLPDFARQAGRMVRQLRSFANNARDDIRAELGPEYADFQLNDLDPRKAIRKHILEAWDDEGDGGRGSPPAAKESVIPAQHPLAEGELPPWDSDAT